MNRFEAAKKVLADAGKPLHYNEITKRMLERGLWTSNGATPAATVNAAIAVDIQQHGSAATFARAAPGVFGLRAWNTPTVIDEIEIVPAPVARAIQQDTAAVPIPPDAKTTLSFTDAAERVLDRFGK